MFLLKGIAFTLLKFTWPRTVFHRMLCTSPRLSMFQTLLWGKDELELSDKRVSVFEGVSVTPALEYFLDVEFNWVDDIDTI